MESLKEYILEGVISIAKFYQSPTIIIGPAVMKQQNGILIDWIGVSVSPSAYEKLVEVNEDVSKWFMLRLSI